LVTRPPQLLDHEQPGSDDPGPEDVIVRNVKVAPISHWTVFSPIEVTPATLGTRPSRLG
jgi:hypothetical protein